MELYTRTSYKTSKLLTHRYSTSFSASVSMLPHAHAAHIYALYGLVRIADEIVDTYAGADAAALLDELERDTYASIARGYSPNPIVHAFALTAARYGIDRSLIAPFFFSMRLDLTPQTYTPELYARYIEGSAEVIGLMSLKIFVDDAHVYAAQEKGARRLGAAYQKVNFLRDIHHDAATLQRWYFPYGSYETFNETLKRRIIADIEKDFRVAKRAAATLPKKPREAVLLSMAYYEALLGKLRRTPAERIKTQRIRIGALRKLGILIRVGVQS